MVLNPVDSGLAADMKSSGSNLAGASLDIPSGIQFEYIKKIAPRVKKIGVIYSEAETGLVVAGAKEVARRLGLELVTGEIKTPAELPHALRTLIKEVDFLWSVADSNVLTKETIKEILIATLRERLPFMGLSPAFVRAGALAALYADNSDIGRQAAIAAKKTLQGKKPSDLSIAVPEKIKLILNVNTINLLGIDVPKAVYDSAEVVFNGE